MMNRFRKILSAALAGCMAVSALMMSAGAANTGTEAAREKAIYGSQAWTVNGAAALQHSDGTVEPVPEFSALYPGGQCRSKRLRYRVRHWLRWLMSVRIRSAAITGMCI